MGYWDTARGVPTQGGAQLLAAISESADPDLSLRVLAELADRARVRRRIEESSMLRQRIAAIAGVSMALGDVLIADEGAWRCLDDPQWNGVPGPSLMRRVMDGISAAPHPVAELRHRHRQILLTIATADVMGEASFEQVASALSGLADATMNAAMAIATPGDETSTALSVIAMGKCGGRELNYFSDVDVLFLGETESNASPAAATDSTALAREIMRIYREVAWPVDANLRPEGREGPLVRSLASYQLYYQKWAHTWEFQALLKARFMAGSHELAREWQHSVDHLVWTAAERPGSVGRNPRDASAGGASVVAAIRLAGAQAGPGRPT